MRKSDIRSLSNCSLFVGLDGSLVSHLSQSGEYETAVFSKGSEIFSPENYQKSLAVILKGSAEVSKRTQKGTLYMSELKESDIFGMSCIFYGGKEFPTVVTAKEDVRVLFITQPQLMSIFALYPDVLVRYLGIMSEKIHFLNEKIESISSSDPAAAIKSYLLKCASEQGSNTFVLPISCSTLSRLLGIGRTSLYRGFDELAEEGFLKKDGKIITVLQNGLHETP